VKGDDESAEQHRKFYDEYNAVLDMPADYYLETIKTVFQEFHLPKGTWEVEGKLVPQDIKTVALFTVEGELDDISGAGQTQAAHELCSSIPANMKQDFVAPAADITVFFPVVAGAKSSLRKLRNLFRNTPELIAIHKGSVRQICSHYSHGWWLFSLLFLKFA
jgi:polyhydroxyalkanoate depolymerase